MGEHVSRIFLFVAVSFDWFVERPNTRTFRFFRQPDRKEGLGKRVRVIVAKMVGMRGNSGVPVGVRSGGMNGSGKK